MKKLDEILALADEPIEVTPPKAKKPVRLRWPSFAEWHELAVAHRKLDGQEPPAELIAKTVAVCLADEDGNRKYGDGDLEQLLQGNSRILMWLYVTCWQTVLKNDEEAVKQEEGK
jgi:hypothetical protein